MKKVFFVQVLQYPSLWSLLPLLNNAGQHHSNIQISKTLDRFTGLASKWKNIFKGAVVIFYAKNVYKVLYATG